MRSCFHERSTLIHYSVGYYFAFYLVDQNVIGTEKNAEKVCHGFFGFVIGVTERKPSHTDIDNRSKCMAVYRHCPVFGGESGEFASFFVADSNVCSFAGGSLLHHTNHCQIKVKIVFSNTH